jgi:long-chain acyl-CoA synthetase
MPDKTAIVFGQRRISFAEWDRQANQVAHALLGLGQNVGDRVALYTPNCPEYEIVFMGAARIGAVPTPLNPSYKEREVRHQLADSGASILFVHAALYPVVAAVRDAVPEVRQVFVIGDEAPADAQSFGQLISGKPDTAPEVSLTMDDLAALPYSSGTTGLSKGVMLTQRNLVCNALQFVQATESTEHDSLLIFLPLYHIYGVALMAISATCGATQVLMERFDLQEVIRSIGAEGITELYVVPPVMLALASTPDLEPDMFRNLRFIMSAAAPLAPEVARRVSERLEIPVIQAYGLTESSPLTHMVLISRATEVMGSVGVVAADTTCRIVDIETGEQELSAGKIGEVIVSGPQVMAGYWRAPDDTAYALRNGWLYTGDIGRVDKEGNLYIVDRKKEMIKYKAWSIAPAELEATLLEHPAVNDCAVVGAPHPEAGEAPHAFVVLGQGQRATPEELQRFVADRVASYKQIQTLEIVEAIPRTPSGKILRRILKERTLALS